MYSCISIRDRNTKTCFDVSLGWIYLSRPCSGLRDDASETILPVWLPTIDLRVIRMLIGTYGRAEFRGKCKNNNYAKWYYTPRSRRRECRWCFTGFGWSIPRLWFTREANRILSRSQKKTDSKKKKERAIRFRSSVGPNWNGNDYSTRDRSYVYNM